MVTPEALFEIRGGALEDALGVDVVAGLKVK
jgi:hypothetical protein